MWYIPIDIYALRRHFNDVLNSFLVSVINIWPFKKLCHLPASTDEVKFVGFFPLKKIQALNKKKVRSFRNLIWKENDVYDFM